MTRTHRTGVVLAAMMISTLSLSATVAAQEQVPTGPAEDVGDVVVVAADDLTRQLSGGGSAAVFTLRPPADASCPGDSASDNWRISSFIIPADDDPAELVIGPFAPEGEGRWPLYRATTSAYINEALEQNFEPGDPARLLPLPPLSFGVFPTDVLPPGRYTIGLICSQWKIAEKYWDTEILITEDVDDEPGGFRWSVPDAPEDAISADAGESSSSTWWWVGGGAVVLFVVVFLRPRSRPEPDHSRESPPATRSKESV